MTRAVGSNDTVVSSYISFSLELRLSHLLALRAGGWTSGVLSDLNYVVILCSGPGLQRHCYILTVSYLPTQGALQICVLSPFWDESWGQSTSLSPFPFSPPFFPHSMGEDTHVHSCKGCRSGWISAVDDQETWETTSPAPRLLQVLSVRYCSYLLSVGELILLKA